MEIFKEMANSVIELNTEKAKKLAQEAINNPELDLLEVIEKGFGEGIRKVGDLWEEGEYFLPELMRGAQVMQEASDIITSHLEAASKIVTKGTIIMATAEGDIHTIGKEIVATMLKANGFKVIDLGADVSAETILSEIKKHNADLVGVSALLTTTLKGQKEVVDLLIQEGLRDKVKVMIGGAPVTDQWVKECGADGSAENAVSAVELTKKLLKIE